MNRHEIHNEFHNEFQVSIKTVTKELRKESLSIKNRLQSILDDSRSVQLMITKLGFKYPVITNERCGCWYVPTWLQTDTCYFKSTDGHTGYWKFSNRRTNLHLLAMIIANGGISVVDLTRKGKRFPDALVKTIPIWCAVLNHIRFDGESIDGWLTTPASAVSASEHQQMASLIESFAIEAQRVGSVTKKRLELAGMDKPIIPEWVQNSNVINSNPRINSINQFANTDQIDSYRFICISAVKTENTPSYYVQGAADDHELWTGSICQGKLDYKFLWDHIVQDNSIVDNLYIHSWLGDEELITRINHLFQKNQQTEISTGIINWCDVSQVKNENYSTNIYFGQIFRTINENDITLEFPNCNRIIILSENFQINLNLLLENSSDYAIKSSTSLTVQQFKVADTKVGSKQLRDILPQINLGNGAHDCCTLVLCDSGKDLSAAVVLMWLCLNYDLNWQKNPQVHVNKDYVKRQLALLQEVRKINPRRNSLQSVNAVVVGVNAAAVDTTTTTTDTATAPPRLQERLN